MDVWTSRVHDFLQLGYPRTARVLDIWDCRRRSFISHLRRHYTYFLTEELNPFTCRVLMAWYRAVISFERDVTHMVPILRRNLEDEWLLYSDTKKKFYLWDGYRTIWYVGRNWPKAMRLWQTRGGFPRAWPHGSHPREVNLM